MRVSIFSVQDKKQGKVMVFKGSTMAELLEAGHKKLFPEASAAETKQEEGDATTVQCPLKKVYLEDGAEIGDIEEIRDGDKLYFAAGNFDPSTDTPVTQTWTESATTALLGAQQQANTYLGAYSALLTEKFPSMQVTIDSASQAAAQVAAQANSSSVKQWADEQINRTIAVAHSQGQAFLASEQGKAVNEALQSKVVKPAEVFASVAATQFQSLREQSEEKKVSVDQFVEGLKTKMGDNWSESLVEPAKAYYSSAQTEFAKLSPEALAVSATEAKVQAQAVFGDVQKQLGVQWSTVVSSVIQSPASVPASMFYTSAQDSFTTLQSNAQDKKVSADEFVGGLKIKLGALWSDQLQPAANQLYEQFQKKQESESKADQESSPAKDDQSALP